MNITFWGAAREVTGSKHLLEVNGKKILLDCGMFQGRRAEAEEKNRNLPFEGSSIDAVVLSHAHMDHCGSLPTLYKTGFRGPVYATRPTCDVTKIMLEDAADIQISDARHINKYKPEAEWIDPIYTHEEVAGVLKQMQAVEFDTHTEIFPGVEVTFIEAGHILGSAQVVLHLKEGDKRVKLGFTGDLGRRGLPILKDPAYFDTLDYLVSESTYGNRLHEPLDELEARVQEVVLTAAQQKGKIIVPAFALGRTQGIVYILHKLTDEGKIPRIPIYVDSPMATELTEVFTKNQEFFDDEITSFFADEDDPFSFRNLRYTPSAEDSKALNYQKGPMLILSTSGMAETGRIRHHLKHAVEDSRNVVMVVGFMAQHTLGRRIVEREKQIKIFDRMYDLNAKVFVINSFSAHAGKHELLDHIKPVRGIKETFLVHGEENAQDEMKMEIEKMKETVKVHTPELGQQFELK
ncbi:MAG: MBL fold metallo-hydrolase [Patescibacteria group bacterium]